LADGPPPLYIGFGSLTETCDKKMTEAILEIIEKLSVRTIFCGSFLHLKKELLPPHLLWIESAPHDWLFPKVLAIVHHGGAGTTHASLQSGKPSLIIPFALDQFHWADKIVQLGSGPPALPKNRFSQIAFEKAMQDLLINPSYHFKANACSEIMKQENGVHCVVEMLEKHCIDYHVNQQDLENCVQRQIIKKKGLILALIAAAFALLAALY
jgi:sterol 3beta-glucosyltransferase